MGKNNPLLGSNAEGFGGYTETFKYECMLHDGGAIDLSKATQLWGGAVRYQNDHFISPGSGKAGGHISICLDSEEGT